jgi:peroxiredoxin
VGLSLSANPARAAGDKPDLCTPAGVMPADEAREAPDFSLSDLDGGTVRLSDFGGRVVVLNFWATWCGPCVKEMPTLQRLRERLGDRGLEVLAVSVDIGDPKRVADFAEGYGWRVPILLDPMSTVANAYAVRVMPTTYVIGPNGMIRGRSFGALQWDTPAAVALMESLLTGS